jgi:hypothetical protein
LKDRGVDVRIILKWIFKNWKRDMNWIDLAQDRGRWRALVNVLMNTRVPYNARNFFSSLGPVSFSSTALFHGVRCLDVEGFNNCFVV